MLEYSPLIHHVGYTSRILYTLIFNDYKVNKESEVWNFTMFNLQARKINTMLFRFYPSLSRDKEIKYVHHWVSPARKITLGV